MRFGGINPYSFAPLRRVDRQSPPGHEMLPAGRFSGSLTVELEAVSPILIGDGDGQFPRQVASGDGSRPGLPIIPGSSLKGAIRSVHEALTDSCLRVVDLDFIPTHRTPVVVGMLDGWTMAMVHSVRDGLPMTVIPCTDVIHLAATGSQAVLGQRTWATGDRFRLDEAHIEYRRNLRKRIALAVPEFRVDGDWILLVTDTKPRPAMANGHSAEVRFAAGKLDDPTRPVTVSNCARFALARELDGAEDLQARNDPEKRTTEFADVYWPLDAQSQPTPHSRVIGRRRLAPTAFVPGIPVWVKLSGAMTDLRVIDIRLAQAWRDRGEALKQPALGAVSARIGDAAPCIEPDYLCPTCRVFGSAGDDDAVDGEARQRAYRGHVRFRDAVALEECLSEPFERAPLTSPKPSAGQFYLNNAGFEGGVNNRPLAFWGSEPDSQRLRPIRGRKFYWRATQAVNVPSARHRSRRRDHHHESQVEEVTVAAAGARFAAQVTFDGLTPAEIGALACAISPDLLWGKGHAIAIGGGKPFGWGSVIATVELMARTAKQRYLGQDGDDLTLEACVAAFEASFNHQDHVALRHLLTLDFVDDAQVHYPANLANPLGDATFDFWALSRGQKFESKTPDRPLKSLPDAAAPPAAQRIVVEGQA